MLALEENQTAANQDNAHAHWQMNLAQAQPTTGLVFKEQQKVENMQKEKLVSTILK